MIITTIRHLRHGHQQQAYLNIEWKIQLTSDDFKSPKEIALEDKENAASVANEKLLVENADLK